MANGNENLSGQGGDFYHNVDSRYKAVYESGETEETTTDDEKSEASYQKAKDIFGDAVWETSNAGTSNKSWFSDYSVFPRGGSPFFLRGGHYSHYTLAGLFCFYASYGGTYAHNSFRPVLSVF